MLKVAENVDNPWDRTALSDMIPITHLSKHPYFAVRSPISTPKRAV